MKRADVKSSTYIDPSNGINDEDPKFKIDEPKVTFQIDLKRFLLLQKKKPLCCGHVICDKKRDLFLIKK